MEKDLQMIRDLGLEIELEPRAPMAPAAEAATPVREVAGVAVRVP